MAFAASNRSFPVLRPAALVAVLSIAFTVLYALVAGPDANWDLRNYHFWSVYAMLNGRTFFDVAPAQIQSWTNPLVYVPSYLVVKHTPPFFGSMLMGAWAGVNGVLIYHLSTRLIRVDPPLQSIWLAGLIAVCGLTGPIFLSQVGTTFSDPVCSIFVLAGLLALFSRGEKRFLLCGFFLGVAVGLKLTSAAYAAAMAMALPVGWRSLRLSLAGYGAFVLGGCLGATVTGGYWILVLYLETGNPVFPYYNEIFQSHLYDIINFSDQRFLPHSFLDALSYPFQWLVGMHPSAEVSFRDARFAILSVLIPVAVAAEVFRARSGYENHSVNSGVFRLIVCFFALSYLLWITVWGIQRYATILELLSGLVLYLAVDRLPLSHRLKLWMFVGLVAFCVLWTQPGNWGRPDDFGESYFSVDAPPPAVSKGGTLFIMVGGGQPIAYVIPYLPEDARFVRLTGNMGALTPDRPLGALAQAIVGGHPGPVRTLSVMPLSGDDRAILMQYGFEVDEARGCQEFSSRHDSFLTCPLRSSRPIPASP